MNDENTLLRLVDGVACPCPSIFEWSLYDISANDAGRVQDEGNTMYKMRTGQKRKLILAWNNPDPEKASKILQMFNPEYVHITYWDAMDGCEETREFTVGDRDSPARSWTIDKKRYTQVAFNVTER